MVYQQGLVQLRDALQHGGGLIDIVRSGKILVAFGGGKEIEDLLREIKGAQEDLWRTHIYAQFVPVEPASAASLGEKVSPIGSAHPFMQYASFLRMVEAREGKPRRVSSDVDIEEDVYTGDIHVPQGSRIHLGVAIMPASMRGYGAKALIERINQDIQEHYKQYTPIVMGAMATVRLFGEEGMEGLGTRVSERFHLLATMLPAAVPYGGSQPIVPKTEALFGALSLPGRRGFTVPEDVVHVFDPGTGEATWEQKRVPYEPPSAVGQSQVLSHQNPTGELPTWLADNLRRIVALSLGAMKPELAEAQFVTGLEGYKQYLLAETPLCAAGRFSCMSVSDILTWSPLSRMRYWFVQPQAGLFIGKPKEGAEPAYLASMPYIARGSYYESLSGGKWINPVYRVKDIGPSAEITVPPSVLNRIEREMVQQLASGGAIPLSALPALPIFPPYERESDAPLYAPLARIASIVRIAGHFATALGSAGLRSIARPSTVENPWFNYPLDIGILPFRDAGELAAAFATESELPSNKGEVTVRHLKEIHETGALREAGLIFHSPEATARLIKVTRGEAPLPFTGAEWERAATTISQVTGKQVVVGGSQGEAVFVVPHYSTVRGIPTIDSYNNRLFLTEDYSGAPPETPVFALPTPLRLIRKAKTGASGVYVVDLTMPLSFEEMKQVVHELKTMRYIPLAAVPTGAKLLEGMKPIEGPKARLYTFPAESVEAVLESAEPITILGGVRSPKHAEEIMQWYTPQLMTALLVPKEPAAFAFGELMLSTVQNPAYRSALRSWMNLVGQWTHEGADPNKVPGAKPLGEGFLPALKEAYERLELEHQLPVDIGFPARWAFLEASRVAGFDTKMIGPNYTLEPPRNVSREAVRGAMGGLVAALAQVWGLSGLGVQGSYSDFVVEATKTFVSSDPVTSPRLGDPMPKIAAGMLPPTLESLGRRAVTRELAFTTQGNQWVEPKTGPWNVTGPYSTGHIFYDYDVWPLTEILVSTPGVTRPENIIGSALDTGKFLEETSGYSYMPFGTDRNLHASSQTKPVLTTAKTRRDVMAFLGEEGPRRGFLVPYEYRVVAGRQTRPGSIVLEYTEGVFRILAQALGGEIEYEEPESEHTLHESLQNIMLSHHTEASLPVEFYYELLPPEPQGLKLDLFHTKLVMAHTPGLIVPLPAWAKESVKPWLLGPKAGPNPARLEAKRGAAVLYLPGETVEDAPKVAEYISEAIRAFPPFGGIPSEPPKPYEFKVFSTHKRQFASLAEVTTRMPVAEVKLPEIKKSFGDPLQLEGMLSGIRKLSARGHREGVVLAYGLPVIHPAQEKEEIARLSHAVHGALPEGTPGFSLIAVRPTSHETYGQVLFEQVKGLMPYAISRLRPGEETAQGPVPSPTKIIGVVFGDESFQSAVAQLLQERVSLHYKEVAPAFAGLIAGAKVSIPSMYTVLPAFPATPELRRTSPALTPLGVRSLFGVGEGSPHIRTIPEGSWGGAEFLRQVGEGIRYEFLKRLNAPSSPGAMREDEPGGIFAQQAVGQWLSQALIDAWKTQAGTKEIPLRLRLESGGEAALSYLLTEVQGDRTISCVSLGPPAGQAVADWFTGLWFAQPSGKIDLSSQKGVLPRGNIYLALASGAEADLQHERDYTIRSTVYRTPSGAFIQEDVYGEPRLETESGPIRVVENRGAMVETARRLYNALGAVPARLLYHLDTMLSSEFAGLELPSEFLAQIGKGSLLLPVLNVENQPYLDAMHHAARVAQRKWPSVLPMIRQEILLSSLGMAGDWRTPQSRFVYMDYPAVAAIPTNLPPGERSVKYISEAAGVTTTPVSRIAYGFTPFTTLQIAEQFGRERGAGRLSEAVSPALEEIFQSVTGKGSEPARGLAFWSLPSSEMLASPTGALRFSLVGLLTHQAQRGVEPKVVRIP